jgi:ribosomal protein S6--L-glutamate ligase
MRIGLLMVRHPQCKVSPIMPEVVELLEGWGAAVDTLYPDEVATRLSEVRVEHDLYVLKSGSELALSLAGALHAAGATIINPYPVALACRDKVVATRLLQSAGVPTPETYVAAQIGELSPLLDDGPLVVKPYRGTNGVGVHVVWDPDQLDDVAPHGGVIFAQRYHKPEGRDRKMYVIGGQVFGVKRVWPARTYEEKLGEPFTITGELREIALACGRTFGIELYGLDIILSEDRPYVVDISSVPGFKGVPDAALRLADYIYSAAERVLGGEPPIPSSGQSGVAA